MAVQLWQAGQKITASRLNAMLSTWQSWTPTWATSTGSNTPSFGNATINGAYTQTGDTVLWRLEITFGSTTNFGGGTTADNWRFSPPVTAATSALIVGIGEIQGSSGAERMPVRARLTTTTTMEIECSGRNYNNTANNSNGLIDSATPWTWANTYAIRLQGQYQAA